jgi:hypothetical protein
LLSRSGVHARVNGKRVVEVMAPDSSSPQDTFVASTFHEVESGLGWSVVRR